MQRNWYRQHKIIEAGFFGDAWGKWKDYNTIGFVRHALKELGFYQTVGPEGTPLNEDQVQQVITRLERNSVPAEDIKRLLTGPNSYVMV